jgi:hypothetical protein
MCYSIFLTTLRGKLNKKHITPTPKECRGCNVLFLRRDNEMLGKFKIRWFCSTECRKKNKRGINHTSFGVKRTPEQIEIMKVIRSKQKNVRTSSFEKMFLTELTDKNIEFEVQKTEKINNKYHPSDVFIKPNIHIELDGCYPHFCSNKECFVGRYNIIKGINQSQRGVIERDNQINQHHILKNNILIRIKECVFYNNPQEQIKLIINKMNI